MNADHPLATKDGMAFMGWLISAYGTWAKLTRSQRKALNEGTGSARPLEALTKFGLWSTDGITPLGRFVRDVKAGTGIGDYAVDGAGNLLIRLPGDAP